MLTMKTNNGLDEINENSYFIYKDDVVLMVAVTTGYTVGSL